MTLNERYPVKCGAFIRDPDQNKLVRHTRHGNAFYGELTLIYTPQAVMHLIPTLQFYVLLILT